MQDNGAKEPQLAGGEWSCITEVRMLTGMVPPVPSGEDVSEFDLMSSLFGASPTCSPDLSQSHPTTSGLQDTSTPLRNEDLTCELSLLPCYH